MALMALREPMVRTVRRARRELLGLLVRVLRLAVRRARFFRRSTAPITTLSGSRLRLGLLARLVRTVQQDRLVLRVLMVRLS